MCDLRLKDVTLPLANLQDQENSGTAVPTFH